MRCRFRPSLVRRDGGLGAIEMFGPNLGELAKGRQVIGIDLQGHDRTADIDRPLSPDLMADDIAALIQHLTRAADIMGYSLGGGVAVHTAIRHPEAGEAMKLDFDFWTPVMTSLSDPASRDQSGFNSSGTGITGSSGGVYKTLTATVPAGAIMLRFRYQTDPAVTGEGFVIDNLSVPGNAIDGAEDANAGWTFSGFKRSTGTEVTFHFNAYVVEARMYLGNDVSLRTAYNFGFLDVNGDKVEFYPYQDGVLISYWDESFSDNNVGDHPGGGLILPIDAHPTFEHWSNGQYMRQRIQAYDSTFSPEPTDAITLHLNSQAKTIASKPAVPLFNDLQDWRFAGDGHTAAAHGRFQVGWTGVNVPKTGTTIRVMSTSAQDRFVQIEVAPAK